MKKSLSLIVCSFCFAVLSSAQSNIKVEKPQKQSPVVNQVSSKQSKSSQTWVHNYVVNDQKLRTFFISGEIPASFPKYNHELTHEENIEMALKWAMIKENYALLTEHGKEIFLNRIQEFEKIK